MNPTTLNAVLGERYSVLREIGRGGMATVFLAQDLKHDRKVALKVLDPELGAVLGGERFLSEIRVTANLQHPNLLPLFDSGAADGMLFYVMPYVEGESLRHRLVREKQLPVDEALHIAVAIANALDYAHSHGVVHRDLKPENILLQRGDPVVADFGIALAVSNAGGSRVTQTGISLGTPQYMSPEQAVGDRAIDRRSDIYSLAAVVYEMLAGEPPHSGTSGQAIIAKLMTEDPRPLTSLRRSVPLNVEAAVHRGLEKLPADRWRTAKEFADALRGIGPVTTYSRVAATKSPRNAIMLGVAVVATLIAAGEALLLRRVPAPSNQTTLRFPFVTPDSERFLPTTPAVPFSISPDDHNVAYIGAGPNGSRLLVRGLDDMQSLALVAGESPLSPTFSPDGKWIALALLDRIVKVSVTGGPPVTIRALNGAQNAGMMWDDRDTLVLSIGGALEATPVDGGPPRALSHPDTSRGELLQWGPRGIDGRFVAYIAVGSSGIATNRLAILDRKTGRTTITPHYGTTILGMVDDRLLWVMSTGTVMAAPIVRDGSVGAPRRVLEDVFVRPGGAAKASMSRAGSLIYQRGVALSRLVVVDEHGAKMSLGVEPAAFSHPRWSPDGTRIAVAVARAGGSELWLIDARTMAMTKLTTGGGYSDFPAWTDDGKRIVYRSADAKGAKLRLIAADGSDPAGSELPVGNEAYNGFLSHDEKWVVYRTSDYSSSFRDIFRAPVVGGTKPQVLVHGPASDVTPALSPDGAWLAYTSDVSGSLEIYLRPFDGSGGAVRVSAKGGSEPMWSRDGRTLFYREGRAIVAATIAGTPPAPVSATRLFDGPYLGDNGFGSYDVAADGKRFLMLESADRQTETIVIYNWAAELRRAWR